MDSNLFTQRPLHICHPPFGGCHWICLYFLGTVSASFIAHGTFCERHKPFTLEAFFILLFAHIIKCYWFSSVIFDLHIRFNSRFLKVSTLLLPQQCAMKIFHFFLGFHC
jgi:hypothetical protein